MSTGSAFDCSTRALLPVRKRSGRDELVLWGRKEGEPGDSELIPSVSVNTIKNGDWKAYAPRWVKLFVARFQMPDATGAPQWHDLPQGAFLQGVLIRDTDERNTRRVYIACIDVPEELASFSYNGQWPHVSEPLADEDITKPAGRDEPDDDDAEEMPEPAASEHDAEREPITRISTPEDVQAEIDRRASLDDTAGRK